MNSPPSIVTDDGADETEVRATADPADRNANIEAAARNYEARKWRGGRARVEDDCLAVEEPLEIRLGGRRFTLTMRTPGHDTELAAGFLFAEGFIATREELGEVRRVRARAGAPDPNAIDVILNVPAEGLRHRMRRNFVISSSCGVCGKTSIDAIRGRVAPIRSDLAVTPGALLELTPMMRRAQEVFAATGGLHAAALFDAPAGPGKKRRTALAVSPLSHLDLTILREDVGRHNAADKVVGHALMRAAIPLARSLMMVSGRTSFEIVQKAAAAGIPILAAVSAPSSLAVDLARELGITLVGFLRDGGFNIYSHPERVAE